jgi:hypothetical protein
MPVYVRTRIDRHVWDKKITPPQDAQKVQISHPPNPGAPRRAFSQARPQRAKRRVIHFGTLSSLRDARTPLADFFSILLVESHMGSQLVIVE